MATWREITYMVLDEIKSLNSDSSVTEDHVIFLANHYRLFLLEQKKEKQGVAALSESNYQTICLDLEKTSAVPGLDFCTDTYLKSVQEIPTTIDASSTRVYPINYYSTNTAFVTKDRFKYVGFNPALSNITYYTLGPDNHVYLKSSNPQFQYLKEAKVTGIFEDSEKAAELACDKDGEEKCDILDQDFPLEGAMIPQLLELIVKELYGTNIRPKDDQNNSADDMAELVNYVRRNMKSDVAKQLQ